MEECAALVGDVGCRGIDTFSFVAVEESNGRTDGRQDFAAIDTGFEIAVRQSRDLVLIVGNAGTQLPLPVLRVDDLTGQLHVEAVVLQRTIVAPVLLQTRQVVEVLQCEQVVGDVVVEVGSQLQAIVEGDTLDAEVEA